MSRSLAQQMNRQFCFSQALHDRCLGLFRGFRQVRGRIGKNMVATPHQFRCQSPVLKNFMSRAGFATKTALPLLIGAA